MKECKYRLPCDWCDKFNKKCEEVDYYKSPNPNTCCHEWYLESTYQFPKDDSIEPDWYDRYVCRKCGYVNVRKVIYKNCK